MTSGVPVEFDDEDQAFSERVATFAQPFAADYLEMAKSTEFPWSAGRALAAEGLLGLGTSVEYGGAGPTSYVRLGILQEQLSLQNFYLAQFAYTCNMMAPLLEHHLQSPDRASWIRGLVRGEHVISIGVTEPDAGGDAAALSTTARRVADGWIIDGQKVSISFAPHAVAVLVLARVDDAGITAFLVPFDSSGVSRVTIEDSGWKPIGRSRITLDGVKVADAMRVGPVGGSFRLVLNQIDHGRSIIGLMANGVARSALDASIVFAKSRAAFGRNIGKFQGVSFPIVEAYTQLEAARWLSYRALSLADLGRRFSREASMSKHFAVESALEAIRVAVLTHGHQGFSEESPFQAMLRDVSGLQIGEGTPQIQKIVVARDLFGREYV